MRSLFVNMVLDNLIERYDRLVVAERKAHEEWVANRGEEGYLQAWTNAIEELNETDQAINLMQRIIRKEEAHKEAKLQEAKREVMEVINLEDAEMFDQFIIYNEDEQQWDMTTYELLQHNIVRQGDHFFTLKNLKNGNVFPSYLNPLNPIHIVKKAGE